MTTKNLNIGIILQYNLSSSDTEFDADTLIKQARNYGFRGVEFIDYDQTKNNDINVACEKYGIKLCTTKNSIEIDNNDNLAKLINVRLQKKNAYFKVTLDKNNEISSENYLELTKLRKWIDRFGHAFYNARPISISSSQDNVFVFENYYASYQVYIFISSPLPEKIELGACPIINHASWIDTREDLEFKQTGSGNLAITLNRKTEDEKFDVYAIRLQLHRPEDDQEFEF